STESADREKTDSHREAHKAQKAEVAPSRDVWKLASPLVCAFCAFLWPMNPGISLPKPALVFAELTTGLVVRTCPSFFLADAVGLLVGADQQLAVVDRRAGVEHALVA